MYVDTFSSNFCDIITLRYGFVTIMVSLYSSYNKNTHQCLATYDYSVSHTPCHVFNRREAKLYTFLKSLTSFYIFILLLYGRNDEHQAIDIGSNNVHSYKCLCAFAASLYLCIGIPKTQQVPFWTHNC